jgi:uncharacterized protein YacL
MGGLIGFPFGLLLESAYQIWRKNSLETPTEIFLGNFIPLIGGGILLNLPLLPNQFVVILTVVTIVSMWVPMTSQSYYWLSSWSPRFFETTKIVRDLLAPPTRYLLDWQSCTFFRLKEIAKTGFLEGNFVIPVFIIQTLQKLIHHPSESIRRRSQKALKNLNSAKLNCPNCFQIDTTVLPRSWNLGTKYTALLKWGGGILLSGSQQLEFNESKLPILFLGNLSTYLESPYRLGDTITIKIVSKGQKRNEAVGILENGTKVIVRDSHKYIGKNLRVIMTHIIHSPKGSIVFADPLVK